MLMPSVRRWIAFGVLFATLTPGVVGAVERKNPDELISIRELPDVFTSSDGAKVDSKEKWSNRREQLKELVLAYEYGQLPPAAPVGASEKPWQPSDDKAKKAEAKRAENGVALPAGATETQFVLATGPGGKVSIPLVITKPAGKGPFPVIVRGDLCWGRVTTQIAAEVVSRGYMLAEFDRTAIVPDENVPNRDVGLYAIYPDKDFGALAAWAWGYHRTIDYLLTRDDVQKDHVAVTGHSRGGKTALLAGATDERVSLTVPNNSGCGGAGCYRFQNDGCETIDVITNRFPYWFQPRFNEFVGKTDRLPLDQHFVKALVAPRAFLTMEALGDVWANPEGAQKTFLATKPVYELLGAADKIGIIFRQGGHEQGLDDWKGLLDFADKQFFGKTSERKFDQLAFTEDRLKPDPNRFTWMAFRGPTMQGTSDSTGLPTKFNEDENVVWKTAIHGRAWSSPVILGKQIWLTTASPDGRKLDVVCVDPDGGKVVKDIHLFDVEKPQYAHPFNSYASPTPVLEPGRLYVSFGSPGVACVDTETGKTIWQRRDFKCNHYRGAGSSLTVFGDLLLLNFDGSDYQYVAAVDKRTGETKWKADRSIDFQDLGPNGKPQREGDMRKGFSTPRISMLTGSPEIISLGSKCTYSYDRTGKELWRYENRASHSGSATPVIGDGLIYSCSGLGNQTLYAIKPGGHGVLDESAFAWKVTKNVPGKPSVLLVSDRIYMTDDGGIASCLDANSGSEIWRGRLKGNYSASPLYADGKIYFFNEDGTATVVEAGGNTFKILAENELDDGFMASPAVSGKALFLRTMTHLYRIEQKK
jgi:outer membrane protein assembly factor BamB/dienelactone hydrolase